MSSFFLLPLLVNLLIIEYNVHTQEDSDRKADAVTPIPPNVETKKTPSVKQLAHVLESALRDDLVGTYWKGTLTPKAESSVVWRGAFLIIRLITEVLTCTDSKWKDDKDLTCS